MNDKPDRADAKEAERKIDRAYRSVFGVEGSRTEGQQIVWNDLIAGIQSQVFRPNASGQYDPLAAAMADGGRRLFLQIKNRVERQAEPEKPKSITSIK